MAKETKKSFASLPKPIDLTAPDAPEGAKRGRRNVPEFDAVPVGMPRENAETRRIPPPPPPPLRPGDFPKKRRPSKSAPPPRLRPRRKNRLIQRLIGFRINPLILSVVGWSVAGIAIIAFSVWFIRGLLVDNAYAVFLDGEHVGYIAIFEGLTSEDFHNEAVLSLEAIHRNVRVRVDQRVTIERTRTAARNREARGDIIARINHHGFTFTIAAHAIYVNGVQEALLSTQSDLNHVEFMLQEHWRNEHTVSAEFVGNWEVRTMYVCPDETEFDTPDSAYFRLDRSTMQLADYTVVSGDTLDRIAVHFGTTTTRIMEDNNMQTANIWPGDTLLIYTQMPLLSVRTFDEIHDDEAIEAPIENRYNVDMPLGTRTVIQDGMAGLARVTERITRINGVEQSREILEAEVVVEPIPDIVEYGVGE
ncbi:MAG: G5 domain-containing protein [Defluviitaleaceae bacterium]|nr:G5 domain-containing protein [Defluviitaleaceae bacterium]